MKTLTYKQLLPHLVCEFSHWDACIKGLVEIDGVRKVCLIANLDSGEPPRYTLHDIAWDAECDEFLADHRKAFEHWFYVDGKRSQYDGRDMSWFGEKWQGRNPIVEKSQQLEMTT